MHQTINNSLRANNAYWFSTRLFGAYMNFGSSLIISIGIFVGIEYSYSPGLYSVSILFLMQLAEQIQWNARQIINT
jgi:hypothetical protein